MEQLAEILNDLAEEDQLRETLKKLIDMFAQKVEKTNGIKRFRDKHAVKPNPRDGEKEEVFKSWTESLLLSMSWPGRATRSGAI